MTQLLKVLASKPDDLNSVSETHMAEGDNKLWPPQIHHGMSINTWSFVIFQKKKDTNEETHIK